MAEMHSTQGKMITVRPWAGFQAFWPHGTTQMAGIGLLMSEKFLKNFNPLTENSWLELVPGRLVRLRLKGLSGGLDVFIAFLTTGNSSEAKEARTTVAETLA